MVRASDRRYEGRRIVFGLEVTERVFVETICSYLGTRQPQKTAYSVNSKWTLTTFILGLKVCIIVLNPERLSPGLVLVFTYKKINLYTKSFRTL